MRSDKQEKQGCFSLRIKQVITNFAGYNLLANSLGRYTHILAGQGSLACLVFLFLQDFRSLVLLDNKLVAYNQTSL